MDSHLKGVPGLGTLTTGGLAGGDLEVLGGEADGALNTEVLRLGTVDELGADLLEGLDLARGEGDADLVDLGGIGLAGLLGVLERHFGDGLVLSRRVSRLSQGVAGYIKLISPGQKTDMAIKTRECPRLSDDWPFG